MLRAVGADVVGMSTVPEVIAAVHGGMRVLGLSIITDQCLPDALEPASVEQIIATARQDLPDDATWNRIRGAIGGLDYERRAMAVRMKRVDGTVVAEGKETRQFDDGHWYVMETALKADVSLVKAWKADKAGNLVYRKTSRNFNPNVAMAGKITIVEVEKLVEVGEIDPDEVHTPSIFVHRIVVNPNPEKRIEQRTTRAQ